MSLIAFQILLSRSEVKVGVLGGSWDYSIQLSIDLYQRLAAEKFRNSFQVEFSLCSKFAPITSTYELIFAVVYEIGGVSPLDKKINDELTVWFYFTGSLMNGLSFKPQQLRQMCQDSSAVSALVRAKAGPDLSPSGHQFKCTHEQSK